MDRVYMTFLSKIDLQIPSMLKIFRKMGFIVTSTDFVKYLYDNYSYLIASEPLYKNYSYLIASEPLYKKQFLTTFDKSYPDGIKNYFGIRPVIDTNNMQSFIEKNATFVKENEIKLGSYPTSVIKDEALIQKLSNAYKENKFNDKQYHIPIGDKIIECDSFTLDGEDYVYIKENGLYVKVTPLNWLYDEVSHSLVCKDIIAGFSIKLSHKAFEKYGYNFLNKYLLRDVLQDKITRLTEPVDIDNQKYLDELQQIYFPFNSDFEVSNDGKLYFHAEREYNINIDESIKRISTNMLSELTENSFIINPVFNINIKGDKKIVFSNAFNFSSLGVNAKIKNLNIDGNDFKVFDRFLFVDSPIENVSMHCDFNIFTSLYLCGKKLARNCLKGSNLTINYKNEKELIAFLNDIQRFINLFAKTVEKRNRIDFTYKHVLYKPDFFEQKDYDINAQTLFSKMGLKSIKLVGPSINKEKITNIFGDANIKYSFTDIKKDNTKLPEDSKNNEKKPKLSKEAEHILDLAREILSIDYIGLDKESVRKNVDTIVIEYNNGLSKKETGLSLSTNNGVYTSAVIKLENLRDILYHNFEKNMDYYDILDLIENMIKKLNNEETNLDYEILKDLETLNNILKYSKDEQTKNELITYLESESQSIVDYLSGKKEIDYKNINEFVKKFRLFLVPILTRVSGNVSKVDVMEQIKDYALNEMNNKTEANTNNYIKLIMNEIDKTKKNILELDSSYVFEELNYSSFSAGKEIIDYLNQKYMEYYRVYLDLMENKVNEENYENSKVPLSY